MKHSISWLAMLASGLLFTQDLAAKPPSGGGGGDPAPVILAGWSGGTGAEDLFARDCTSDGNSSGIYDCDLIGEVEFNLTGGDLISRKGSQDWCNSFNVRTTGNTNYRLYGGGDSGDCTTGNCTIGILNTSVGTHDVNVANGWPADVGLLIIKANWDIPAPSTGVNPFADPLVLDEANWLTVDFNQAGSNKKLASCMFRPAPGELIFVSVPQ